MLLGRVREWVGLTAPAGAAAAPGGGLPGCWAGPLAALCPLVGGAVRGNHGSDRGPQEEVRRQVQRREPQPYSWDLGMGTFPEPPAGM